LVRNALLAGAFVLTISCDPIGEMDIFGPDEDTSSFVDGSVLYRDTGDPVPGVEVRIVEHALFEEWPATRYTTETDAKGHFHMNFTYKSGYTYEVEVETFGHTYDASLAPGENRAVVLRVPSLFP